MRRRRRLGGCSVRNGLFGEPARGNTVEVLAQEVRYSVVQYFVIHNDAVYTVTLSSDESALPGARSDFDELLDSWHIAPSLRQVASS
jgi:hypothetical protein